MSHAVFCGLCSIRIHGPIRYAAVIEHHRRSICSDCAVDQTYRAALVEDDLTALEQGIDSGAFDHVLTADDMHEINRITDDLKTGLKAMLVRRALAERNAK